MSHVCAILLIAHAPLATALAEVGRLLYPEAADSLHALDVGSSQPMEELEAQTQQMQDSLRGQDCLILADVYGATPFNIVSRIAAVHPTRSRIVAGVNVPMLWRALAQRHVSLEELANRAVGGGTQGIV